MRTLQLPQQQRKSPLTLGATEVSAQAWIPHAVFRKLAEMFVVP